MMAFSYSVLLSDDTNQGATIDALLVRDLQAALADWSAYISGIGTLLVQLIVGTSAIHTASGGPTVLVGTGVSSGGATIMQPSSIYELIHGTHLAASDIIITVDPGFVQRLFLDPSPGGSSSIPADKADAVSVFRHELGHGFGMVGGLNSAGVAVYGSGPGGAISSFDDLIRRDGGAAYFVGARAVAMFGGPVPLTSSNPAENYYHLANSVSDPNGQDLMNGVAVGLGRSYAISNMDLAILADIGVPVTGSVVAEVLSAQATVMGAGGQVLTLAMLSEAVAAQMRPALAALSNSIAAGSVVATRGNAGGLAAMAPGMSGLAQIDGGGAFTLSSGYIAAVDMASDPVTLTGAVAGNLLVIAGGSGDLTYSAVAGAETIYAGRGAALVFGNQASLNFIGGTGTATVCGGQAGNTVHGGSGRQLVFGTSSLDYTGGTGAATVVGGVAGNLIAGGAGDLLAFGTSRMSFTGGAGAATLIGGSSGGVAATMGRGGGLVFGSPSGGNLLSAGDCDATLVGGNSGDVVTASGTGRKMLVAGGGTETLNGAASSGDLVLFGGSGADSLVGGSGNDLLIPGTANETLTGGLGSNYYLFNATPGTARMETITDFDPNRNSIGLFGFAGGGAAALASARIEGGVTAVTLSDGTRITFMGAPVLTHFNFF